MTVNDEIAKPMVRNEMGAQLEGNDDIPVGSERVHPFAWYLPEQRSFSLSPGEAERHYSRNSDLKSGVHSLPVYQVS